MEKKKFLAGGGRDGLRKKGDLCRRMRGQGRCTRRGEEWEENKRVKRGLRVVSVKERSRKLKREEEGGECLKRKIVVRLRFGKTKVEERGVF